MSSADGNLTLRDPDILPLYVGMAVFALANIYHTRIAKTFVGNYKDKVYFYLTHLIDVAPMILYIFKIIEIGMLEIQKSNAFFTIFYLEWIFATSLMLLSLGRLVRMPLAIYIRIIHVDIVMITGGYISMLGTSAEAVYIPFGVASLCFLYILYTIYRSYRKYKHIQKKSAAKRFWEKVYAFLTRVTMVSWLGYPLNHILYKVGAYSFATCLLVNVILDMVSKILFVNTLIGSHLVYRGDTSVLAVMTRRMLKIHALDVTITENIDSTMTHTVALQLDMHRVDPHHAVETVTHVTHVSELEPVPSKRIVRFDTHDHTHDHPHDHPHDHTYDHPLKVEDIQKFQHSSHSNSDHDLRLSARQHSMDSGISLHA